MCNYYINQVFGLRDLSELSLGFTARINRASRASTLLINVFINFGKSLVYIKTTRVGVGPRVKTYRVVVCRVSFGSRAIGCLIAGLLE